MRLILTRHGETEENKLGIVQGHMQGTLSKEGIHQAEKLAERLRKEKIDAIFSSDLKRAVDTSKIILSYHPIQAAGQAGARKI
jgi:broad specificity phosphatase PhoE